MYAVFQLLLPDVNEETQSPEENTPSTLEAAEKTMSATIPETTRIFSDIASFPDDSKWIKESTIALIL